APPSACATVGTRTPRSPSFGQRCRGHVSGASISAARCAISRSANARTASRSSSRAMPSVVVSAASIGRPFPPHAAANLGAGLAVRWPDGARRRASAEGRMPRLATHVDTGAPTVRENASAMQALVDDLTARLERVRRGGGDEAVAKHEGRGKLTARARIEGLLDDRAGFLELSALAAEDLYDGAAPAAGHLTGIRPAHGQTTLH